MPIRRLPASLAIMIAGFAAIFAHPVMAAADSIAGRWITQDKDAVVVIAKCGATMCGTIAKFLVPPPGGLDQRDVNNPKAALRKRKLLGLAVLHSFKPEATLWRGQIYDPKSGKTYRSVIRRKSATTLEVKGCVGPFCQTQIWRKAS
jgi:uncharacterized protein (DUF2147 family)